MKSRPCLHLEFQNSFFLVCVCVSEGKAKDCTGGTLGRGLQITPYQFEMLDSSDTHLCDFRTHTTSSPVLHVSDGKHTRESNVKTICLCRKPSKTSDFPSFQFGSSFDRCLLLKLYKLRRVERKLKG